MSEAIVLEDLRLIVFDVDGTLYRQDFVRRGMTLALLRSLARKPLLTWRIIKALRAYRLSQERLRHRGDLVDTAQKQIEAASAATGEDPTFVRACVESWIEEAPLPLIARGKEPALDDFLKSCKRNGIRLAVLSDYPAEAKLQALNIREHFDDVVSAQDSDVGAFKPSPKGLRAVLRRRGLSPSQALYVGDRLDVDLPAARAASMPCAILRRRRAPRNNATYIHFQGYRQLEEILFAGKQDSLPARALRVV